MGLTEVRENDLKDTPHNIKTKNSSIRNLLTKKCEKHTEKGQTLKKMANIIFQVKIRTFDKSGNCDLEMSHPELKERKATYRFPCP